MPQNFVKSNQAALAVHEVFKKYGETQALGGVSFQVEPGEVFGLLGPNGAGKTSLISIVVTLEKATSGEITVFGHDVATDSRSAKLRTGWVPQEIVNHGFFTVEEIMHFHAGYYGVRKPTKRIHELLHALDLWEHRNKKVKQLSGGMKRRLMIAKALNHNPGLLLLDEPTAGVDVELRTRLWELVEQLRRDGVSILLTTHYLEEAERLCDRVAIIHNGKIQAVGKTQSLIKEWSRKRVVIRLEKPVDDYRHPDLVSGSGLEWTFLTKSDKPLGELLSELQISSENLCDVKVAEGNLEDVFRTLTTQSEKI